MRNTDVPQTKYDEGALLAIPLRDGGFARGIVVRRDAEGLAFGYFFGPRTDSKPDPNEFTEILAEHAVLLGLFGDQGIIKRKWSIVGQLRGFKRELWPMPMFICDSENRDQVQVVQYDEDTLRVQRVINVPRSDAIDLPRDQVMGHGAVEIKLTRLLGGE